MVNMGSICTPHSICIVFLGSVREINLIISHLFSSVCTYVMMKIEPKKI